MELTTDGVLEALPHDLLARVAREHMLWGHLIDRALMPELIIAKGMEAIEGVAIDEWMGASPNYTARMRRLVGIEGDTVPDIMKALQLDVGFVHQYMDVGYSVTDHAHGEFWLNHCGALVDVEPMGEQQVISMCHHIEDPTFDATALATNPKARIRPFHRPPRSPGATGPACHWSVEIDEQNPPVPPIPLTGQVAALALTSTRLPTITSTGDGLDSYRGPFIPDFRLELLSSGALRAVVREFDLQAHLIAAAGALAVAERHGPDVADAVSAAQSVGVSWVGAQRLASTLGSGTDLRSIATVIAIHPLWPTGVTASVEYGDDDLTITVDAQPGVLDPSAPGWLGLLAGGDTRAVAAIANSLDQTLTVESYETGPDRVVVRLAHGSGETAPIPHNVELLNFSSAATWQFTD